MRNRHTNGNFSNATPSIKQTDSWFCKRRSNNSKSCIARFFIPLPFIGGIGPRSAIVALSLYSLLPVISSTHAGIKGIDPAVIEAGRGMGMNNRQLLTQVEIPLAAGVILAGIRVAMVLSIGIATIAALTGAGGLGTYIFRGISMLDHTLIFAGAIPSALLALSADSILGIVQKHIQFVPVVKK